VRIVAPLLPAVAALGASFGVLARTAHFDALAAVVMSATTFAGSAQVAAVSVLGAGGGVAAAVVAALLLNARYVPMEITVAQSFRGHVLKRFAESQLVVDESWALSVASTGASCSGWARCFGRVAAALGGAAIAAALIPFTAPGIPIIAATAAVVVGWRRA